MYQKVAPVEIYVKNKQTNKHKQTNNNNKTQKNVMDDVMHY